MKMIGITGGTGAGKTTALNALVQLNSLVIDADAVYHDLTLHSVQMRLALRQRFGNVFSEEGLLDRKKLGEIVFQNKQALLELNTITHRFVDEEIDRRYAFAKREGKIAVAVDAIALFESGIARKCDFTVGVIAPVEVRVRRIMIRENISEEYARMRIAAQKSEAYYREHCDYILENSAEDTPEIFSRRALVLFETLLKA